MVLAHLFVKVPRPGDSEEAFSVFESSYHLLLPVCLLKGRGQRHHVVCLAQGHNKRTCLFDHFDHYTISFMLNVKQGCCERGRSADRRKLTAIESKRGGRSRRDQLTTLQTYLFPKWHQIRVITIIEERAWELHCSVLASQSI